MSTRSDVLLWAQRVCAKKGSPAHQMLELGPSASAEEAQEAFHKIARSAHPDLHRNALTPDELELITQAYSMIASAYQTFRSQAMYTQRTKPLKHGEPRAPGAAVPATPSGPAPAGGASSQMSSRALVHYRKAELALRQGDLKAAMLNLKMAIAADPSSAFLRTALAEVESEVRKTP